MTEGAGNVAGNVAGKLQDSLSNKPQSGESGGSNRIAGPKGYAKPADPMDQVYSKLKEIDPNGEIVINNSLGRGMLV